MTKRERYGDRAARPGVTKVVSGGQAGADREGWDVALELGLEIGGWVPRARRAEDGRIPDRYVGLQETASAGYAERTQLNVRDSDATVVFVAVRKGMTPGSGATCGHARRLGKPCMVLRLVGDEGEAERAAVELRAWIAEHDIAVLNVAGSSASKAPGLCERVRAVLVAALGAIEDG